MLNIPMTGGRESGYVALRAGSKLLIQDAEYIVGEFQGLLATPLPYPSAQDCTEVHYSLTREDGLDLLAADSPAAAHVSDEDRERLSACYARLKARGKSAKAQRTERTAIQAFRLPDPALEPDLYRECVDPETGERRLAVLWGIAKTDARGRFLAVGAPVPWVAAAGSRAEGKAPAGRDAVIGQATEEEPPRHAAHALPAATYGAPAYGAAAASRCKCWIVGILLLLALGALAALGHWWAAREHERLGDTVGEKLDRLDKQLTRLEPRIERLNKEMKSLKETTETKLGEHRAELKKLGEETKEQLTLLRQGLEDKIGELDKATGQKLALLRKGLEAEVAQLGKATDTKLDLLRKDLQAQVKALERTTGEKLALLRQALVAEIAKLDKATDDKLASLRQDLQAEIAKFGKATDDKLALIRKKLDELAEKDRGIAKHIETLYGFHKHEGTATKKEYELMLGKLRRDGFDVVIVFDSTGSMGREIDEVKRQIRSIGQKLQKLIPEARIGVCTYRDLRERATNPGSFEYDVKGRGLTTNIDEVAAFLEPITAHGGGDHPEAVALGLKWAVGNSAFRPQARKAILLFGDAVPHDVEACKKIAQDFHAGSDRQVVSTVTCRMAQPLPAFVQIAKAGGGEALLSTDEKEIIRQLVILMFGKRFAPHVMKDFKLD